MVHALQFLALARFLEGDQAAARQTATRGYILSAEIQSALAMGNSLSLQSLVASVSGEFTLGHRFAEEAQALRTLAARRPLDRWAGLWEKVARLAAAVDGLNLERSHAFMHMLTLLTPESDRAGAPGSAFGANHVRG